MNVLRFLLLVCSIGAHTQVSFASSPNQLSLIVAPGQPGRVDNHTIDVAQLPAGAPVRVQVQLNNFSNATLAGAEFVLKFPSHSFAAGPVRMRATNGDFQGNQPPISAHSDWGTPNLLILPVDQNGFRTASHVSLMYGLVRFGAVFRDPGDRLIGNGADLTVAEFEFFLGNDTVASCISSLLKIELISCTTGGNTCEYFSDEHGDRILTGGSLGDRTVSLINGSAGNLKGDINRDGFVTNQDVGPLLQCSLYGQTSSGCPLSGLSLDDFVQIADFNCSGNVTNQDIAPLLNFSIGSDGGFKTTLTSQPLKQTGILGFDFDGAIAGAALIEGRFSGGKLNLEELRFTNPEQAVDWELISSFRPDQQRWIAIVVNRNRNQATLPTLSLPYAVTESDSVLHLQKVQRLDEGEVPSALAVNLYQEPSSGEQNPVRTSNLNMLEQQGGDR